jgi:Na+/H+-dicarboxylate symporter
MRTVLSLITLFVVLIVLAVLIGLFLGAVFPPTDQIQYTNDVEEIRQGLTILFALNR